MTETELSTLFSMPCVAIIAPAGHGKTEMIADIVRHSTGKQLLLTHTNAGVDAIKKRMKKYGISQDKYTVATIASFCIKWCLSYSNTSNVDKSLSPLKTSKEYYMKLYRGAKAIFETSWSGNVLKATYVGVVVDEYQDCNQEQHEIFLAMNRHLPIKVLGDPMQGIFSFQGQLVDWSQLEFPVFEVETKPWRWSKSNPGLGEYLMTVRNTLLPSLTGQHCVLSIAPENSNVEIIDPASFTGYSLMKELSQFSSVVYITQWPKQQLHFCERMSGVFQYDEKQDCDELFSYANRFDGIQSGASLILGVIDFVTKCSTGVKKELGSYINRLKDESFDFSHITKHIDFGLLLTEVKTNISKNTIIKLLRWFHEKSVFKKYRTELLSEMERSVRYAIDHDISIFDAANHIRKDASLQKRYTGFKFLSSRTLLTKGLEFDCVIIDMTTPLSAKDFYVAMTRAMKKIYIISNSNTFSF